jgi:hypothetical protein
VGEVTFQSNFALMCERAEQLSYTAEPCKPCNGEGFRLMEVDELARWERRIRDEADPDRRSDLRTLLARESTCTVCHGVGSTPTRRNDWLLGIDSMWTTVRCSRCRATGVDLGRSAAARLILGDGCERCRRRNDDGQPADDGPGNGYTVPITVRSTGSSKGGKPPKREPGGDIDYAVTNWVDEDAMIERGRVGREIDAIRRRNPTVGNAMDDYYGVQGDKWGGHKWGRSFAVWHHTDAGKRLAEIGKERSFRGHGHLLHPLDLIASERDAHLRGETGNPNRPWLIERAARRAVELVREIEAAVRETECA